MKGLFIKGLGISGLVFLALFLGRWSYLYHLSQNTSYSVSPAGYPVSDYATDTYTSTEVNKDINLAYNFSAALERSRMGVTKGNLRRNYAKEVGYSASAYSAPPMHHTIAQHLKPKAQEETYEKIGSMGSWTRDFESDEKKIRATIGSNKVLIQQEENSGLKGDRLLNLVLGVVPEKFDPVIEDLRQIGHLASFKVTKTAKTNDYKTLMAQRDSLERNKADLVALKKRSGKMSELLDLQERIFRIEQQMGDLGLAIGQFEGPTSLCTVLVTLKEVGPAPLFWAFARSAFRWAVGEFFGCFFFLLFAAVAILLGTRALERTKSLPAMIQSKLKVRSKR